MGERPPQTGIIQSEGGGEEVKTLPVNTVGCVCVLLATEVLRAFIHV